MPTSFRSRTGSFDGVVVQAVLEHVLSPATVVAEIHRVLRDGGLVYAETPFMQAVHEGAFDFTRFTDLGHRRLFGRFEEIDRGVAVGPGSSLLWALRYFARSLPSRGGVMVRLLDFAVSCSFFWLIYVDRRLVEHPGGLRRRVRRVVHGAQGAGGDRRSPADRAIPRRRRRQGDWRPGLPAES